VISGPPGCGKTHLISQVFVQQRARSEQNRLIEVSADDFVAEWLEAVRNRRVVEMRELYLAHDVLVCEDLHGFSRSASAQDAFVSLVDEFVAAGGRVVLTCQISPNGVQGLTQRLVNRCHGGICAWIAQPARGSRLKLLRHFAAPLQVPVTLEALEMLAARDVVSPGELLGELRRLVQAAEHRRRTIDASLVREIQEPDPRREQRRVADVAKEVARQFGIALRTLRSESRAAPARVPRQAAMYLSRQVTSAPCAAIGAYFNGRSHSTVVYACDRFEQQLAEDPRLQAQVDAIRHSLIRPAGPSSRKAVDNRPAIRRAIG
jgi:chromosomal replication initiator protein